MSATRRSAKKNAADFLARDRRGTPAWAVSAILPHLPCPGDVLDPCAGKGDLLRAVDAYAAWEHAHLRAFEILKDEATSLAEEIAIFRRDALSDQGWGRPDLVITNPPFSRAMEFVERALDEVAPGGTVAMLLRLGWLASAQRVRFHQECPADVYVLAKRPSFTGNGKTDATDYAWFVWGPGRGGRWEVLDSKGAGDSK